jgi:hypothetical protein
MSVGEFLIAWFIVSVIVGMAVGRIIKESNG